MFAPRSVLRGPCAQVRADQAPLPIKSPEAQRRSIAARLVASTAFAVTLFLADAALGTRVTVGFTHDGTFTTPSFTESGLTVTSNTTGVGLSERGIGVIGGFSDSLIEPGEMMRFAFSAPVRQVAFSLRGSIHGPMTYEAFFETTSLGTALGSGPNNQVSNIFTLWGPFREPDLIVTSFTMTPTGNFGWAQLGGIQFTPVPEPSGAIPLLVSLGVFAGVRCLSGRRRSAGLDLYSGRIARRIRSRSK